MARREVIGEPVTLHSGELFVGHIGLGPSIPTVYMEQIFRRYLCPGHQGTACHCGTLRLNANAAYDDLLTEPVV